MKKKIDKLNTWTVTSKFNDKFFAEFDTNKYKYLLQDSALKGLCCIDSYPDSKFLTQKDVEKIHKFENYLFTKPHRSIKIYNRVISAASIINFRNYKNIKKRINHNTKILEIGAGVGYLAALITYLEKKNSYYICDLPSTLNILYKFIKSNFPKIKIKFYNDTNYNYKEKVDILLINNFEIKKLKEKFDLIINIDSFSEMDKDIVDLYFKYAYKNLKKDGIFFISNTHGHSNTAYKSPLNYPIEKYFNIKKSSINSPTARDNPSKYLNLELNHKNKVEKKKLKLISKNYFSSELISNSKMINFNQNLFYKSFKTLENCILNKKKFRFIASDFSVNIKILYYSKLFNVKLEKIKIIKDLNIYMLYYFYNKNFFSKIEKSLLSFFYKNNDFLNKIKVYYILGKEKKISNKETNFLFKNSKNNTYKIYFLLALLYLGNFDEFKYYYKKSKLNKKKYYELINFFNYSNLKTNYLFYISFYKSIKKFDFKKIDDLVLAFKLRKITIKKLKILMLKYHNNYYSIGFLLKKTLFLLDKKTKIFFINKSIFLRKNNLQNTNFIFEILYFSEMFDNAKNLFIKHNLKKNFFYSYLKYFITKRMLKYKIDNSLIFDESSLMINNGSTTFIPFFNVGNNNIVISNN